MDKNLQLDCNTCRTSQSMVPARIPKFSGVVRAIGGILLIPSFLGIGFAVLMVISSIVTTSQIRDDTTGGAAVAGGLVIFVAIVIGVISLVGGLLGWLLLLNRNVWKCMRCEAILDRA